MNYNNFKTVKMRRQQPRSTDTNLMTATEAANELNVSRAQIERLNLLGKLTPVSTPYSLYYYDKKEVMALKDQ